MIRPCSITARSFSSSGGNLFPLSGKKLNCTAVYGKSEVTMRNRMNALLFTVSGICFFVAAWIGKNYVFIPIGCCFVILGITNSKGKSDNGGKDNK